MGGEGSPRLGDLVKLIRGTTYSSSRLGEAGPVLLGLASIQRNGGFRADSLKTYGGPTAAHLLLRPGDLYVSLKDVTQSADLLGSIARVPAAVQLGRLTQDTVKLELKPGTKSDFIYWTLRTPQYRTYCRSHATGTTNLGLPREDFLAFSLPEPTADRLALVGLLGLLDDKIELNRRMAETLEAIARTLFNSWFIDFDPVNAKAQGRSTGLPDSLAALFPDSFDDKGHPAGWQEGTLRDLAVLNPESWTRNTAPETVDYVDLANTKWGTIETVQTLSRSEAPSRAQRILRPGDTIVGVVRPGNGSFAYIQREGLTGSTGFAALRPVSPRRSYIIYLAVTTHENIEALASLADGAAYPAVRPDDVIDTPIIIPEAAVMDAFNAAISPVFGAIFDRAEQSRTLTSLRDTLLPKLISGELRIADAEAQISAA